METEVQEAARTISEAASQVGGRTVWGHGAGIGMCVMMETEVQEAARTISEAAWQVGRGCTGKAGDRGWGLENA